jgi:hypothetical protein
MGKTGNRRPEMSIIYELYKSIGKRPCSPGTRVDRCPLIINQNSEDLLMSNLFGGLKYLPPAIWLIPLLSFAFKGRSFNSISQGSIKIVFWQKLSAPPTTNHQEGMQEVDLVIRIRHLIILIECKFKSPVNMGRSGNERDQLARYIDSAVFNLWPDSNTKRDIYLILLTDTKEEPEILSQYRSPEAVFACLTKARPFIDYEEVSEMLARNIGWITWRDLLAILEIQDPKRLPLIESMIISDLIDYLRYKLQPIKQSGHRQERG